MTSPDIDRSMGVTVSGTRSLDGLPATRVEDVLREYLGPFATPATHFLVGGAVGIDTVALRWIAERTESAISVVVPCTVADQPTDAAQEVRRWAAADRITRVVELGADALGTEAYHARNRWMVDRSRLVLAFPRDASPSGGTWYTAEYGRRRGTAVLVAPLCPVA